MVTLNVAENDIIQISENHKWVGCLAVVDEVKAWGVLAYVRIPSNDGEIPGTAYILLPWETFVIIGAKAALAPSPQSKGPDQ